MKLDAFDYDLPAERIAREPARPRESARLLDMTTKEKFIDRHICDLPALCAPGDVVVVNNTSVIPARLTGYRGQAKISVTLHKSETDANPDLAAHTGAVANIAVGAVPSFGNRWRVFAKPAKKCRTDDVILFAEDFAARVLGRGAGGDVVLAFFNPAADDFEMNGATLADMLARYGSMPLPPYIARPDGATSADKADYQTMFAQHPGAVAAPTAGLHFTENLAKSLTAKGVKIAEITLHVGAGTFLPVTVDNIADHKMHSEWGAISADAAKTICEAQQAGRRIIAVGTTSLRILEACFQAHGVVRPFAGETDIFITPGYKFGVVDALLTNFHLPKSTLLMLVSAFCGMRAIGGAYQHAIDHDYRFFSYGDACFMHRATDPDITASLRGDATDARV